jgi:hypothetical protein
LDNLCFDILDNSTDLDAPQAYSVQGQFDSLENLDGASGCSEPPVPNVQATILWNLMQVAWGGKLVIGPGLSDEPDPEQLAASLCTQVSKLDRNNQ